MNRLVFLVLLMILVLEQLHQTRRRLRYFEDVQRAFYSGYFTGHGLKVQAVTLPNGLFGSVFVAPLRASDTGLQSMSGLDFI